MFESRNDKRIFEIDRILSDGVRENELRGVGVPQVINDAKVAEANKFLIAERQQLMLKREFAIARRDNLFWKCVWNVFVPILVTVVTTYLLGRGEGV